jgi:hypothetical protein
MAGLMGRLEQVLSSRFRGAKAELKRYRPGNRVGGSLTWKGFEGMPQIERQTELRRAIDSALPANERLQVSFILTLTPDEEAVMAEQS